MVSYVRTFVTPWTAARQAPLFMEFPRQEDWNGLPFSIRGGLPDPGIKPTSPMSPALVGGFSSTGPPRKPGDMHLVLKRKISVRYKRYLGVTITLVILEATGGDEF